MNFQTVWVHQISSTVDENGPIARQITVQFQDTRDK